MPDPTTEIPYGTPMWRKPTTGPVNPQLGGNNDLIPLHPCTEDTTVFMGATAQDGDRAEWPAGYSRLVKLQQPVGTIYVRVHGPVEVGDPVGREVSAWNLVKNGTPSVGTAQAPITDGNVFVIPVLVGAGGGGSFSFKGEWDPNVSYAPGDIVVRGTNNRPYRESLGVAPYVPDDELEAGDQAGTYYCLNSPPVNAYPPTTPLHIGVNVGDTKVNSYYWQILSRSAYHRLVIKPTLAMQNCGSIDLNTAVLQATINGVVTAMNVAMTKLKVCEIVDGVKKKRYKFFLCSDSFDEPEE